MESSAAPSRDSSCSVGVSPPESPPSRRRSIFGPPSLSSASSSTPPPPPSAQPGKALDHYQEELIKLAIADLSFYYGVVKRQIMFYQNPLTGLYPETSRDKEVACVRSSIYANMSVWSLFQAYKRIDDDQGKSYELGQSVVIGVRGILSAWMKQAEKVEAFKSGQDPANALHSKFGLRTGEPVLSLKEYNHLQIDVVSLFLLVIVQTVSSGLKIIYCPDEVAFVQNLVFYIERAYRTPDFGMWGRGTVYNDGTCEVHASSIGMAKAALEAVNGFNLYGEFGRGSACSIVYVDIDAHNRNRNIFETLVPRESSSKGTDAGLIPTISFPAFATHDQSFYKSTKQKVIETLEGHYGFKRHIRDSFGTAVASRDGGDEFRGGSGQERKIQEFSGIESEWPLFFALLVIDGVFKKDEEQVDKYQEKLRKHLSYNEYGDPVLPQYFYVPFGSVDEEREAPGSQHRVASNHGAVRELLHLWSQSVLIIADLLTSELLNVYELDPARRHLPSYHRGSQRYTQTRYSAFEKGAGDDCSSSPDLVVQVVMISESIRLQAILNTYGIVTQTPDELEPIEVWSQSQMVKVYQMLGSSPVLGLKGRPPRPIGALGSSKMYRLCGTTVVTYPLIFSSSEFYLSHDMALLMEDIRSELKFISQRWRLSGRPTFCIVVTENNMRDPQFLSMLTALAEFRTGMVNGVKVNVGRVQNLVSSSCLEHLDFLPQGFSDYEAGMTELSVQRFTQLQHGAIQNYSRLTEIPKLPKINEEKGTFLEDNRGRPSDEIASSVIPTLNGHLYGEIQLLGLLMEREGDAFVVGDGQSGGLQCGMTVHHRLKVLNRHVGAVRHWAAVRYSASLLKQMVDSLSPYVTQILVNGKMVTVGTMSGDQIMFDKPKPPAVLHEAIYTKVQPFGVLDAVLQQELILYCGKLVATNKELFAGILNIRLGWFLHALDLYRRMKQKNPSPIENCSPSEVRRLLYQLLCESKMLQLNHKGGEKTEDLQRVLQEPPLSVYQVRQINGCLSRVPGTFYSDVWLILERSPKGIHLGDRHLPQDPTLSQMANVSPGKQCFPGEKVDRLNENPELSEYFALLVDDMLNGFTVPEYKALVVELLCVFAAILKRNPELDFTGELSCDLLIQEAVAVFKKDHEIPCDEMSVFYSSPVLTTSGYLARAVVNNVLKGSIFRKTTCDYNCPVQ